MNGELGYHIVCLSMLIVGCGMVCLAFASFIVDALVRLYCTVAATFGLQANSGHAALFFILFVGATFVVICIVLLQRHLVCKLIVVVQHCFFILFVGATFCLLVNNMFCFHDLFMRC